MATSTTFTLSSRLETLPFPVLESICEYLTHCGSKRRSLFAFSLASKYCCFVSTRERFKQVSLTMRDRRKLHRDIQRWEEILSINERIRCVRRVRLLGHMSVQDDEPAWRKSTFPGRMLLGTNEEESETDEHEGDEDEFFTPSRDLSTECYLVDDYRSDWHTISNEEKARNKEWLLLARLLEQIPNLRDVVYACTHRIPKCILTALHRYHPNTRLHFHTFNLNHIGYRRDLRRLCQRGPNTYPNTAPHEFLPLLSPCLHSIVVLHSVFNSRRDVDYSRETALQRIRIASPRLRHLRVSHCPLPSPHDFIHRPPMRRVMWDDASLTLLPRVARSRECVQNLVLDMFGFKDSQTDVSPLHSLEIENHVNVELIQKLTRISQKGALNSLHTLALWIAYTGVTQPSIDEAASLLLQTVPPLKDLKLIGPVAHRTFTMILSRHGETLRKLQFIPAYGNSVYDILYFTNLLNVDALSRWCPNLEYIELRTRRTRGDEEEMSVYRALSTLRRLKRVKLHLDYWPSGNQLDDMVWYPFIERLAEPHIREGLVNSAIDSSLAQSIFRAIFPSTNATTPPNQQLPTLELHPLLGGFADGSSHTEDFRRILYSVAKHWAVSATRDASDGAGKGTNAGAGPGAGAGAGAGLRVREIKKQFTLDPEPYLRMYHGGDVYERVWKELWPPKHEEETTVWWENWWSFPLFSA